MNVRAKERTPLQLCWSNAYCCNGVWITSQGSSWLRNKSQTIRKGTEKGIGSVIPPLESIGFFHLEFCKLFWLPHQVKGVKVLQKDDQMVQVA